MKSCLNATTLRQGLSLMEFIDIASQAGFEGIEINIGAAGEYADAHSIAALRGLLTYKHLVAANFGLGVRLGASDADFEADLETLPNRLKLGQALGMTHGMVVTPFRKPAADNSALKPLVDRLRKVADVAVAYGIDVLLEFIGLRPVMRDQHDFIINMSQTYDLIERMKRENVGVLLDSYHWYTGGSTMDDLARLRGVPLFVHINDAPAGDRETLTDPMRVLPGEGVIGLPEWLRAVRSIGYDGYLSVELFREDLRALEPLEAARLAKLSLDKVLAQL